MSYTKRQIVEMAFNELALAGYVYTLRPEELQMALQMLDTMMAEDSAQDVDVGYAFGTSPDDSDLDQDSGLPLIAVSSAYLRLAVRLAASKGKQLMPSTVAAARSAYDSLLSFVARGQVQQQKLPGTLPRGAGNKPWRGFNSPFFPPADLSPLQNAADGGLEFVGE